MKVGIIVHSHTGNTLSIAQKIQEALITKGHSVSLEKVSAVNEDPSAQGSVELKDIPDISGYDALIFGAPVRGFSLTPTMSAYLAQLPSLNGKKVGCFITQHFPFAWMGGNRTIKQMTTACTAKGSQPFDTGIVNWSSKKREEKIGNVLKSMGSI